MYSSALWWNKTLGENPMPCILAPGIIISHYEYLSSYFHALHPFTMPIMKDFLIALHPIPIPYIPNSDMPFVKFPSVTSY